jgi:hypothetical protein
MLSQSDTIANPGMIFSILFPVGHGPSDDYWCSRCKLEFRTLRGYDKHNRHSREYIMVMLLYARSNDPQSLLYMLPELVIKNICNMLSKGNYCNYKKSTQCIIL